MRRPRINVVEDIDILGPFISGFIHVGNDSVHKEYR
jgi:hypothetical protein